MQLGISTYTYGWAVGVPGNLPLKPITELDLIRKAQAFGLRLVQIGDNLPLHTLPEQRLQALLEQAGTAGITLEIGARGLTSNHLHHYLGLTKKLNARLLRFVIDGPGYEPEISQVIQIIKKEVSFLEANQITIGLENHDRLKAREFAQIIEGVNSAYVGICLDSVNSMGAGEGLEEIVEQLAPFTVNLHIKDFGIQRLPHLMGFQIDGRPAGQGMLNLPWLLHKLAVYNRCQTAVLEQWVVPEASMQVTLQKEEVWAEESLAYLQSFFKS
ncbi:sugar phosphate isomerase/epimerase family protein [Adhaeribacter pallidiroseus]|uniref:Xylose isomerase-like TIM barrel domain-containing protein n=1 Tax=Adhaeribacter pallidiroseus TaxID=2072847 RepID=A0A369QIY0_9BACT|nr:TIM barrel protein [Adhaeribacter pallidiroseus]RDC62829.1 hypothetical protein AHMF7616_01423 [Adhaeribacter pallidiroseus]